jgi:hypothetical protein
MPYSTVSYKYTAVDKLHSFGMLNEVHTLPLCFERLIHFLTLNHGPTVQPYNASHIVCG